jgi:hypothetical protein
MSWLKAVIAQLLGLQTKPLDNPVQPTQTVGLANKVRTTKTGNKRSVVASIKPPKSVTAKPSSKRKAVQPTTQASSRKAEPKSAPKTLGQTGRPRKTPAPLTPQAVKPAPKRKV